MNKTILVIAAHSDDEALGCSGTIAKHIKQGDRVHLLFMTDGVGSRNVKNKEIKKRRRAEKKSASILGVSSIQNFDFPDNEMDAVPLLNIVKSVEGVINKLQPEIIYTHHIGDLNIDHQLTHKAVMVSCRPKPGFCVKEIYAFEVLSSTEWQTPGYLSFSPNLFVDISQQIEIKRKSLLAYKEEMHESPYSRNIDNVIRLSSVRGNAIGVNNAEAFVIIRVIA